MDSYNFVPKYGEFYGNIINKTVKLWIDNLRKYNDIEGINELIKEFIKEINKDDFDPMSLNDILESKVLSYLSDYVIFLIDREPFFEEDLYISIIKNRLDVLFFLIKTDHDDIISITNVFDTIVNMCIENDRKEVLKFFISDYQGYKEYRSIINYNTQYILVKYLCDNQLKDLLKCVLYDQVLTNFPIPGVNYQIEDYLGNGLFKYLGEILIAKYEDDDYDVHKTINQIEFILSCCDDETIERKQLLDIIFKLSTAIYANYDLFIYLEKYINLNYNDIIIFILDNCINTKEILDEQEKIILYLVKEKGINIKKIPSILFRVINKNFLNVVQILIKSDYDPNYELYDMIRSRMDHVQEILNIFPKEKINLEACLFIITEMKKIHFYPEFFKSIISDHFLDIVPKYHKSILIWANNDHNLSDIIKILLYGKHINMSEINTDFIKRFLNEKIHCDFRYQILLYLTANGYFDQNVNFPEYDVEKSKKELITICVENLYGSALWRHLDVLQTMIQWFKKLHILDVPIHLLSTIDLGDNMARNIQLKDCIFTIIIKNTIESDDMVDYMLEEFQNLSIKNYHRLIEYYITNNDSIRLKKLFDNPKHKLETSYIKDIFTHMKEIKDYSEYDNIFNILLDRDFFTTEKDLSIIFQYIIEKKDVKKLIKYISIIVYTDRLRYNQKIYNDIFNHGIDAIYWILDNLNNEYDDKLVISSQFLLISIQNNLDFAQKIIERYDFDRRIAINGTPILNFITFLRKKNKKYTPNISLILFLLQKGYQTTDNYAELGEYIFQHMDDNYNTIYRTSELYQKSLFYLIEHTSFDIKKYIYTANLTEENFQKFKNLIRCIPINLIDKLKLGCLLYISKLFIKHNVKKTSERDITIRDILTDFKFIKEEMLDKKDFLNIAIKTNNIFLSVYIKEYGFDGIEDNLDKMINEHNNLHLTNDKLYILLKNGYNFRKHNVIDLYNIAIRYKYIKSIKFLIKEKNYFTGTPLLLDVFIYVLKSHMKIHKKIEFLRFFKHNNSWKSVKNIYLYIETFLKYNNNYENLMLMLKFLHEELDIDIYSFHDKKIDLYDMISGFFTKNNLPIQENILDNLKLIGIRGTKYKYEQQFFFPISNNIFCNKETLMLEDINNPDLTIIGFKHMLSIHDGEPIQKPYALEINEIKDWFKLDTSNNLFIWKAPTTDTNNPLILKKETITELIILLKSVANTESIISYLEDNLKHFQTEEQYRKNLTNAFKNLDPTEQDKIEKLLKTTFHLGMYMRRWKGPSHPFPMSNDQRGEGRIIFSDGQILNNEEAEEKGILNSSLQTDGYTKVIRYFQDGKTVEKIVDIVYEKDIDEVSDNKKGEIKKEIINVIGQVDLCISNIIDIIDILSESGKKFYYFLREYDNISGEFRLNEKTLYQTFNNIQLDMERNRSCIQYKHQIFILTSYQIYDILFDKRVDPAFDISKFDWLHY